MDKLAFIEAAYRILKREGKPLDAEQITSIALSEKLISTTGKTPTATMSARIYVDIKKKGDNSRFSKVGKGKFYLREIPLAVLSKSKVTHKKLEVKIREIGELLGKWGKEEYSAPPYVYDVVWKETAGMPRASHVFEIQDKGNVDSALSKLQHAKSLWNPRLFLIVTGERDRKKVDLLLKPVLGGTFHLIAADTIVLTPEGVEEIHRTFTAHKEAIRQLI